VESVEASQLVQVAVVFTILDLVIVIMIMLVSAIQVLIIVWGQIVSQSALLQPALALAMIADNGVIIAGESLPAGHVLMETAVFLGYVSRIVFLLVVLRLDICAENGATDATGL